MIGFDTNVLLRLILQDSPIEGAKAQQLLESIAPDTPVLINAVVVHEMVWVLRRTLGWSKADVLAVLQSLLDQDDLTFSHEGAIRRAMAAWEDGSAHFADYFIAEINADLECATTYTFDRKAATHPAFSPVM